MEPLKLKDGLKIENIGQETIKAFIEPAEDWHVTNDGEYASEVSLLNFTWVIVNLDKSGMDIKLNFTDPTAISPLIRFDKLVLILDDIGSMFDKYEATSKRRML